MTHQKNSQMNEKNPVLIFDTNIFLTGIDFNIIDGIIYTTPTVIDEVKVGKYREKNRNILTRIYAAIENNKLRVKTPKNKYIQEIANRSKFTGDFNALSFADKELIALALDLKENLNQNVKIYTNDYSIENVCSELNISFSSLYKEGIKSKIIWEVFCPYCKEIHDIEDFNKSCEKCGSKLTRRPKRNIIY